MIRGQKIARAREMTHRLRLRGKGNRIDGKASLNEERAQIRGMTVIYRYIRQKNNEKTNLGSRATKCVSTHVTPVTKLLINVILSRRAGTARLIHS